MSIVHSGLCARFFVGGFIDKHVGADAISAVYSQEKDSENDLQVGDDIIGVASRLSVLSTHAGGNLRIHYLFGGA